MLQRSKEGLVHIVVVGAGGLGVSACLGILAAWPKDLLLRLTILDPDSVELSNLHRQVLFTEASIGLSKAACLADSLKHCSYGLEQNQLQNIELYGVATKLVTENCALLDDASMVIDCTDSPESKFLINDYCVVRGIPFCYGGATATLGQAMLCAPHAHFISGCMRCLFGEITVEEANAQAGACRSQGILGPVAGYAGFLQAELAIRYLQAQEELPRPRRLLRFSFPNLEIAASSVSASPDCPLGCTNRKVRLVDLRDKACPATFLYTKFALEHADPGSVLEVHFGNLESLQSVSRTMREEGFRSSILGRSSNQSFRLLLNAEAR